MTDRQFQPTFDVVLPLMPAGGRHNERSSDRIAPGTHPHRRRFQRDVRPSRREPSVTSATRRRRQYAAHRRKPDRLAYERCRRPSSTLPGSAGPQPRSNHGDAKEHRPLPRWSQRPRRGRRRHRRGPARTGRDQRRTCRAHAAPVLEARLALTMVHGRPATSGISRRQGPLALLFERLQENTTSTTSSRTTTPCRESRSSKRSRTRSVTFLRTRTRRGLHHFPPLRMSPRHEASCQVTGHPRPYVETRSNTRCSPPPMRAWKPTRMETFITAANANGFRAFDTADRNMPKKVNLQARRIAVSVLTGNNRPILQRSPRLVRGKSGRYKRRIAETSDWSFTARQMPAITPGKNLRLGRLQGAGWTTSRTRLRMSLTRFPRKNA